MKKSVLIRLLGLILTIVLCFGIVACNNVPDTDPSDDSQNNGDTNNGVSDEGNGGSDEGNGGSDEGNGGSDEGNGGSDNNKLTDEEMFAKFLEAYNTTIAYDGAIDLDISTSQSRKYAQQTFSYIEKIKYTTDGSGDRMIFFRNSKENDTEDDSFLEKIFKQNGELYGLYQETNNGVMEFENYTKYTTGRIDNFVDESMELDHILSRMVDGVALATSYADLNSSFDKAYSTIIADAKGTSGVEYLKDIDISIAQNDNGEFVLTVKVDVTLPSAESSMLQSMARSFTFKDGKITNVVFALDVVTKASIDGQSQEVEVGMDYSCDISYAFDEAYYNSVEVSLPTNTNDIYIDNSRYYTINIGGCELDLSSSEATVAETLDELAMYCKNTFEHFGESVNYPLTIKGFYYDEALTRRIDPAAITLEELDKLEAIYADYTIDSGYAFVFNTSEKEYNISREYEIIRSRFLYGERDGYREICNVGTTYYFTDHSDIGMITEVYINGVKYTAETFSPESGKTYHIKELDKITDEYIDISYIVFLI